jgi:hypothetical protein
MPTPDQLADLAATMTADPQLQPQTQAEPPLPTDTQADIDVRASAMLADVEQGMSIVQAATKHGLSRMQGYRLARAWDSTDYEGTVRNLLKMKGLGAVEDWARASASASLKGRHEAARDLLVHAGIIEPVTGQSGTGQTNIAIVIGTPDQPVSLHPRK